MPYFTKYLPRYADGDLRPYNLVKGDDFQDVLFGGPGRDVLIANGTGTNHLRGDDGVTTDTRADLLIGARGYTDVFFFAFIPKPQHADMVARFEPRLDFIDLSGLFQAGPHGQLGNEAFVKGKVAVDADDRVLYHQKTGAIRVDFDGVGGDPAHKVAVLIDRPKVSHADFDL